MVQMIHLRTCHSVNVHICGDKMTVTRDAEWSGAHLGRGDGGDSGYFYIYIYFWRRGSGGEESPRGSLEWCDRLPSLLVGFVGM